MEKTGERSHTVDRDFKTVAKEGLSSYTLKRYRVICEQRIRRGDLSHIVAVMRVSNHQPKFCPNCGDEIAVNMEIE